MTTTIIDITLPLDENTPLFPGDPPFVVRMATTIQTHGYATRTLTMGSHFGTHVDAPSHFREDGMTVGELPLEFLCGEALVLDISDSPNSLITTDELSSHDLTQARGLLLKTKNRRTHDAAWLPDLRHLAPDAARYLRRNTPIRLVGIDTLSIEGENDASFPVHHSLLTLDPPIFVVEGLDLRNVPAGWYSLHCLPLALRGGDAAPARVVLVPASASTIQGQ